MTSPPSVEELKDLSYRAIACFASYCLRAIQGAFKIDGEPDADEHIGLIAVIAEEFSRGVESPRPIREMRDEKARAEGKLSAKPPTTEARKNAAAEILHAAHLVTETVLHAEAHAAVTAAFAHDAMTRCISAARWAGCEKDALVAIRRAFDALRANGSERGTLGQPVSWSDIGPAWPPDPLPWFEPRQ